MPSIRYYNQTAPFWDWVASLEEQGAQHPFFKHGDRQGADAANDQRSPHDAWVGGWAGFPWGPFPHRGRHGPHGRHHHGPPPAPGLPGEHHDPAPPPSDEREMKDAPTEKQDDPAEGPSEPCGPPPPFSEAVPQHSCPRRHHSPGRQGRGCGRGRGGFGGRGRHGAFGHSPFGPMGGFGALADMFQSQIFGGGSGGGDGGTDDAAHARAAAEDFKPDVDVFDTSDAFVVHVSLPGAKKEDVGVHWDAEKSELSIAGVVYRPGDEELLKTLALDERKVGAFERKVRLGSRANPAQVDVDAISAKLEDGILRVDVPKLDAGYVEIKKVDIE